MKQIIILPNYDQDSSLVYLAKDPVSQKWEATEGSQAFSGCRFPKGCNASSFRGVPTATLNAHPSANFVLGQYFTSNTQPMLALTKQVLDKDQTGPIVFLGWLVQQPEFSTLEACALQNEIPEILKALQEIPAAYSETRIENLEKDLRALASGGDSLPEINQMIQRVHQSSLQWDTSVPLLGAANRPDSQTSQRSRGNNQISLQTKVKVIGGAISQQL